MAALNKVMLIGNLTRDPQVRQLPTQTTLAEFGLAVSRRYKTATGEDREETCFLDCTAFGKQAEVIGQYCQKGKPILVEGRLKYDSWEDKQGFGRRSKVSVVVEHFQFLGGRDDKGTASANPGHEASKDVADARPQLPARPKRVADKPFGEEAMFQEADIPF